MVVRHRETHKNWGKLKCTAWPGSTVVARRNLEHKRGHRTCRGVHSIHKAYTQHTRAYGFSIFLKYVSILGAICAIVHSPWSLALTHSECRPQRQLSKPAGDQFPRQRTGMIILCMAAKSCKPSTGFQLLFIDFVYRYSYRVIIEY
jgi:hypothetical protein